MMKNPRIVNLQRHIEFSGIMIFAVTITTLPAAIERLGIEDQVGRNSDC